MKTKFLFLLFLFSFSFSDAQELYLFNVDTTKLPEVSAEYLILDSLNKLVTDVKKESFTIKQDTSNIIITKFKAPQASVGIENASIVLTIDIYKGIIPFIFLQLLGLGLVLLFPDLVFAFL